MSVQKVKRIMGITSCGVLQRQTRLMSVLGQMLRLTMSQVHIESKVHNNLYQIQIATDLNNSEKRWTRHKTSGTWSEWRSL